MFDLDLHEAYVGSIIQVYQSLAVNGNLVYSYIVISILKFSRAGDGTFCARTKLGEVEESTVEFVLDVNTNAC